MTGCQADYGDDRHCGNCQSLASDIPVREVIIHRQECERPERVYHQLSAQGAAAIKFIPHLQPSDARLWGDFLCAVFAIWIKEDANCLRPRCAPGAVRQYVMRIIRRDRPARAAPG